jgi:hypothetical protein
METAFLLLILLPPPATSSFGIAWRLGKMTPRVKRGHVDFDFPFAQHVQDRLVFEPETRGEYQPSGELSAKGDCSAALPAALRRFAPRHDRGRPLHRARSRQGKRSIPFDAKRTSSDALTEPCS